MSCNDDFSEIMAQLDWAAQHFRAQPPVLDIARTQRLVVALECAHAVITELAALCSSNEPEVARVKQPAVGPMPAAWGPNGPGSCDAVVTQRR